MPVEFHCVTSGLYYKHTTIVNYASSVVNKLGALLTDNARVIITIVMCLYYRPQKILKKLFKFQKKYPKQLSSLNIKG